MQRGRRARLHNQSFVDLVTEFWQTTKTSFLSLGAWWDAGKSHLQQKICAFSRSQVSIFRKRISSLEKTLYHLNCRLHNGEDVSHLIADAKADLEHTHRQQSCGAQICSNVQWPKEGEASTAYFFHLEKKLGQ
jgi:hypothetical protein